MLTISLQRVLGYLALFGLIYPLNACNSSPAESPPNASANSKPPVPVTVATVTAKTLPVEIFATGNVQAYATVAIQSRVDGQITEVHFTEGQGVKQGQLLFKIDSRLAKATLEQALANHARAIAQLSQANANYARAMAEVAGAKAAQTKDSVQLDKALADLKRYTFLEAQGAVSRDQIEQYRTNVSALQASIAVDRSTIEDKLAAVAAARADREAAKAQVKTEEAAIETAKVQLTDTSLFAPLTGRTGPLNLDRGNLVKANDTANPLVTISQISPIYVAFAIPERLLPQVKQYGANHPLTVAVRPSDPETAPEIGTLTFIDSGVNKATGTVSLKATFVNSTSRLTPGQMVKVALRLTEEKNALVVPSRAIQEGQRGAYVFVVGDDRSVAVRPVSLGRERGQETSIDRGLTLGERVVTDGQFKLAPGAKVKIVQQQREGRP